MRCRCITELISSIITGAHLYIPIESVSTLPPHQNAQHVYAVNRLARGVYTSYIKEFKGKQTSRARFDYMRNFVGPKVECRAD